ncbi:MAG: Uroporphyrinogen-III methylase [Candidatus Methanohalarchaeum thermophilum]|uniref:uroporphyrinogen-III C-methyltransferase n=1 Tax=Methanohalarchaeum thermophilum TaxID=1903181 RepID=A0A1Q6DXM8_METT1|nr:MAG: Uroporphyrinogen-III methylase [Candidatus Methanohalarchaeum thermophilum]
MTGKVYLIGGGPSKNLITVKGLNALKKSDVIVHDRLIDKKILKELDNKKEIIDAGKKSGKHKLSQKEIEETLIKKAKENKTVARLKGGDPFIFGRGGEETQSLSKENIKHEVIPGITSAIAAPEKYGVPLTHRKLSSSTVILTGHEDPNKTEKSIDWNKLSHAGTIVILMGVGNLPKIVEKIKQVKDEETPIASFEDIYSPNERVIHGKLKNIKKIAKEKNLQPPAVTVIGEVVKLGNFWKKK